MILEIVFWAMMGLVVYAYVGYPAALWVATRLRRTSWKTDDHYNPSVSIIVAAHNEERVIGKRVENLLGLAYPADRMEILIGSDGSDDRTVEILKGFSDARVRVFDFAERRGKVAVLKDLVSRATGEVLVFSDANTMFHDDAVQKLGGRLADARGGAVCGHLNLVSSKTGLTAENHYWRYEQYLKAQEGRVGCALGANGGIYALRRELFENIPDDTIVDDFVIGMKVYERGLKVVYAEDAKATEEVPETVKQEFVRRVRIGAGNFQAMVLCRQLLLPWKGLVSGCFWSHKVLRWFVPFLLVGVFIVNVLLATRVLYAGLLAAQGVFYAAALAGWILERKGLRKGLLVVPCYFAGLNMALLVGFFAYVFGLQKVTWKRTERREHGAPGIPPRSNEADAVSPDSQRETQ